MYGVESLLIELQSITTLLPSTIYSSRSCKTFTDPSSNLSLNPFTLLLAKEVSTGIHANFGSVYIRRTIDSCTRPTMLCCADSLHFVPIVRTSACVILSNRVRFIRIEKNILRSTRYVRVVTSAELIYSVIFCNTNEAIKKKPPFKGVDSTAVVAMYGVRTAGCIDNILRISRPYRPKFCRARCARLFEGKAREETRLYGTFSTTF